MPTGSGALFRLSSALRGLSSRRSGGCPRNGAKVVSLGPRILRTETAGLVALSLVGYRWGIWDSAAEKTIAVCTLGCKVNQYDSDAVLVQFRDAGYEVVDFHEKADVYLINTCTVTNTGDRKSRQMIRRAHRPTPRRVVVMGCRHKLPPEEIVEIEGVSLVVGTHQRHELPRLVESLPDENHAPLSAVVDDIFTVEDFEELPVSTFEGRTRATLKIQDGCNQFCAYCRAPYARGKPRSRSLASVVDQAPGHFGASYYQEIVLTGIHLGAYGLDLDPKLHSLMPSRR